MARAKDSVNQDHPRFSDTLLPLENTRYNYGDTSISAEEGEFLWNLIRENEYRKTIEVGCALGISSLYICDAVSRFSDSCHTIIDPGQTTVWSNIGIRNLRRYNASRFTLIEEPSELALPKLLERMETFDFGFIDGWHTFDHALLDFFYLNRLVRVGGMIVFDDAKWPSVSKVLKYVGAYPAYRMVVPYSEPSVVPRLTVRQRLFGMLCHTIRIVPEGARKEIFSERVLSRRVRRKIIPSIVGLLKIAEDERRWDWYEAF